jgi:hypothetical protein
MKDSQTAAFCAPVDHAATSISCSPFRATSHTHDGFRLDAVISSVEATGGVLNFQFACKVGTCVYPETAGLYNRFPAVHLASDANCHSNKSMPCHVTTGINP